MGTQCEAICESHAAELRQLLTQCEAPCQRQESAAWAQRQQLLSELQEEARVAESLLGSARREGRERWCNMRAGCAEDQVERYQQECLTLEDQCKVLEEENSELSANVCSLRKGFKDVRATIWNVREAEAILHHELKRELRHKQSGTELREARLKETPGSLGTPWLSSSEETSCSTAACDETNLSSPHSQARSPSSR